MPRSRLDEVLRTGAAALAESALPALSLNKTTHAPTYTEPTPIRGLFGSSSTSTELDEEKQKMLEIDFEQIELKDDGARAYDKEFDSLLGIKSLTLSADQRASAGTSYEIFEDANKKTVVKSKTSSIGDVIELKANSGTMQLWRTLSANNVTEITPPSNQRMADLDVVMTRLFDTETQHGHQVEMDQKFGNLSLYPPKPLMFYSKNSFRVYQEVNRVVGIKLWGFAGITSLSMDTPEAYISAVDVLFPKVKEALWRGESTMKFGNVGPYKGALIAIRFDGDPFVEAEEHGSKPKKFTQAIFAPLVAQRLRMRFEEDAKREGKTYSPPPIALLITKVQPFKKPANNFVNKFMNAQDGKFFLRTDRRDSYHTFSDSVQGNPQHTYPGADLNNFDAITLVFGKSDTKFGKPERMQSEVKCELLFKSFFAQEYAHNRIGPGPEIVKNFCICIGGNTEVSARSMVNFAGVYRFQNEAPAVTITPFDHVVRRAIHASAKFVPDADEVWSYRNLAKTVPVPDGVAFE